MSATTVPVLVRERAVTTRPRTTHTPTVRVEEQSRVAARSRDAVKGQPIALVLTFVAVFFTTYFASALAGHVASESVRQSNLDLKSRLATAKKAELELKNRVGSLYGGRDLDDWAVSNGFQSYGSPAEQAPESLSDSSVKKNLVARR